jgi:hypothetical protein
MGHTRLGNLPRTRKWQQVVGLIEGGAGTAQLANATITAAERGFKLAAEDKGMIETVWLLTQLPLAAKSGDFAGSLRNAGLEVSDAPSLMEVIGAFSDAVDRRLPNNNERTDLGEIAQMAAAETMSRVIGSRTQSLFGTTPEDVKSTFSKLATNKQFSIFARDFFARLTNKCLDYFVSRAISYHVGEGRRFRTLAQQGEFTKALETHCREASKIVEEFSGGWLSKTNWEKGSISRQDAAAFAHVAMKKIVTELKEGARDDG